MTRNIISTLIIVQQMAEGLVTGFGLAVRWLRMDKMVDYGRWLPFAVAVFLCFRNRTGSSHSPFRTTKDDLALVHHLSRRFRWCEVLAIISEQLVGDTLAWLNIYQVIEVQRYVLLAPEQGA